MTFQKVHAVTKPSKAISIARNAARVHMVPAASDNLSWLLEYKEGDVAVIDGPSLEPVLDYCQTHGLKITHLINTHIHGDHIGINFGLDQAKRQRPELFDSTIEVWGASKTASSIPEITKELNDGDVLHLGQLRALVWLTEGHLDGHLSYIFWNYTQDLEPVEGSQAALFCGDTLFGAGCGRLFDGPASKMYHSLKRLSQLPKDTFVFSAHEYTEDNLRFAVYAYPEHPAISERLTQCRVVRELGESSLPSTVGLECSTNPFILCDTVELFAELRQQKDQGLHRAKD